MLDREDPFSLAAYQIETDHQRIKDPRALDRKMRRLTSSSHGFLRGSASLFYAILARRPDLARGPEGDGWLVGDMHMENVGAYRTDDDEGVVFDLNDFDDARVGPWRLDILRLTMSVLLGSQEFAASSALAVELAEQTVRAYTAALFQGAHTRPEASRPIAELIAQVGTRKRVDFVRELTEQVDGRTRFKRSKRTFDVEAEIAARGPAYLAEYLEALGERAPAHGERWRAVDVALRLAGNGSLGYTRLWLLIESGDHHRFVELKQQGPPASAALLGDVELDPAERVVAGARALLGRPPFRLAPLPSTSERVSFVGRRLRPEEDKLDLDREQLGAAFPELARIVAGLLGRAHRLGAVTPAATAWTEAEQGGIVDRAIELAALHEGAWLAYARRIKPLLAAPASSD